jgi:hypothetical protein
VSVVVAIDGRQPRHLGPRAAEIVRLLMLLMSRLDEMPAGELAFYWNGRNQRHTAKDVGVRLTEQYPAGVLTQNTGGGMNSAPQEVA